MTHTDDRQMRFAFREPWKKAEPAERFCALELAAEIIFPDKSAVSWKGDGWQPNCIRMHKFVASTNADEFIARRSPQLIQQRDRDRRLWGGLVS
jgi:hypothetical protein